MGFAKRYYSDGLTEYEEDVYSIPPENVDVTNVQVPETALRNWTNRIQAMLEEVEE